MILKPVGFFREIKRGLLTDSLISSISDKPLDNEELIIQYLQNGATFLVSPGIICDILNDSKNVISNGNILTDGVWAWPNYLAYYVNKYHVKLTSGFLEHMKRNHWEIKDKEQINVLELKLPT